jgi:hypothetical protein
MSVFCLYPTVSETPAGHARVCSGCDADTQQPQKHISPMAERVLRPLVIGTTKKLSFYQLI